MLAQKERFTELMTTIVGTEMNETEQGIFFLEGHEWIDRLLNTARLETEGADVNTDLKGYNQGISPHMLDIVKTVCSCGALVVSCASLYLNYVKDKASQFKGKVDRLEAMKKLRSLMEEQQMAPELVEAITKKYADNIITLLSDLS